MFKSFKTILLFWFVLTQSAQALQCPPPSSYRQDMKQAIPWLQKCIAATPSTKSLYFNKKTNQYQPDRQRLHKKIIESMVAHKPCISRRPIVILTGGLPGSGKTTFINKKMAWARSNRFVVIDADTIREKLPDYKGWNATNTQDEVKDILEGVLKRIDHSCKHHILYDSSLGNLRHFEQLIKKLKHKGYDIFIVYLKVPRHVAVVRSFDRYRASSKGRYVDLNFIKYLDQQGPQIFNALKFKVHGYIVVDGASQKIMECVGQNPLCIHSH